MKNLLYLFIFSLMLNSCYFDNNELLINNNYYQFRDGFKSLIYQNKPIFGNRNEIYSTVKELEFNTNFIIVEQEPNYLFYKEELLSKLHRILVNSQNKNGKYYDRRFFNKKYWGNYSDSINQDIIKKSGINTIGWSTEFKKYLEKLTDSLISNNPFHKKVFENKVNFWIIDIPKDTLYGPFQREEYLLKKQNLGIPTNLKLDFEKSLH